MTLGKHMPRENVYLSRIKGDALIKDMLRETYCTVNTVSTENMSDFYVPVPISVSLSIFIVCKVCRHSLCCHLCHTANVPSF